MSGPVVPQSPPPSASRHWIKDALSAVAFLGLALALSKAAWRALGPFGGFFFFAISGGLAWMFARAAWRGILGSRRG